MDEGERHDENKSEGFRSGRLSRAQLLATAGLGIAAVALPQTAAAESGPAWSSPFYPQVTGTYTTEELVDIVRVLHASEHLSAGIMYVGLQTSSLNLANSAILQASVQAALVQHQRHAEFLDGIANPYHLIRKAFFFSGTGQPVGYGPAPSPPTLTVPAGMLDNQKSFFTGVEWLETALVGMYTAAIREAAELGQPTIAKNFSQIMGVEAGLRVLARAFRAVSGDASAIPPDDKAYDTDYFLYVRDAVPVMIAKGFFNGTGPELPIFSPAQAKTAIFTDVAGPMATTVVQQTPNNATTSDATAIPGPRT